MREGRSSIFIVEDHPLVRDGVLGLVDTDSSLTVSGTAGSFQEAVEKIRQSLCPDLLLLDINLPDREGLAAIKDILELCPRTKILVISMHEETLFATRTINAGASGYIMKTVPPDEILDAIHQVLRGNLYVSQAVRSQVLEKWRPGARKSTRGSKAVTLTPRERQVFDQIGQGKTLQQIASELGIATKTVETHRAKIKEKLGVTTNVDLIRYAATLSSDLE